MTTNIQGAAAQILQRGVDLDNKKRYTEALVCYQEGLQLLVDVLKGESGEKRSYLRTKVEEYMSRAEQIKKIIATLKEEGKYHEQIIIEENSTGHSYKTVLNRFLDNDIKKIKIEDPYIRIYHQCQNLLRLCELLVKSCNEIKRIELVTTECPSENERTSQENWLNLLKRDLLNYKVNLDISYSTTLHDRQIVLDTGWIIKIGRGLDYFKPPANKLSLGAYDLDLRQCHETVIDIFHSNSVKTSM